MVDGYSFGFVQRSAGPTVPTVAKERGKVEGSKTCARPKYRTMHQFSLDLSAQKWHQALREKRNAIRALKVMNSNDNPLEKTEVLVDFHQLVYVSIATRDFDQDDLRDILEVSRKNNAEQGITGLLLYSNRNIVQVLAGARENLEQLFEKIRRDSRHRQVTLLSFDPAPERKFKDWSMGYKRIEFSEFNGEFPGFTDIVERKKVNLDILTGLSIKVAFVLNRFSQMNRLDDLGQAC